MIKVLEEITTFLEEINSSLKHPVKASEFTEERENIEDFKKTKKRISKLLKKNDINNIKGTKGTLGILYSETVDMVWQAEQMYELVRKVIVQYGKNHPEKEEKA